jgi:predicted PurR-regulated permease PerM
MLAEWRAWPARRRARLILTVIVALLLVWVLYQTRASLIPFAIGLLGAYLVLPAVGWLQAHEPPRLRNTAAGRVLAIVIVYIAALALLAGFFAFLVPIIISQVQQLLANREELGRFIQSRFVNVRLWYLTNIPLSWRTLLESEVSASGGRIITAIQQGIVSGVLAVTNAISVIIGYLVIPFWLFFVLFDADRLSHDALSLMPESVRPDARSLGQIVNDTLSSYFRGQIIVVSTVGLMSMIALSIIGVNFAVLLGLLVGILDLVPTLGPILALVPVLTIAAIGRPINALWALLAMLAVQQIEHIIISPRVIGSSVRVRPAVIMILLVVGSALWGLLGLIVIVPLTAVVRDTVRYFYARTSPEGATPEEALREVRAARKR